ncbi:glucosamine-6-phosphate deaminase [Trichinella spiralis]|uniref:glucosamine-6-phosphate deaminase n=1 Tax=Trichinella spiralis TaxID=6334 RepID=UPI0001EFCE91|nr:glucosamine-6-phosphate deaminase [Trichinella spiralis]
MHVKIQLAASCGIQLTAAASGSFVKLVLTLATFVTLNLPVLQVENMQLVILNDYEQMSEFAAKFVRRRILDFNPSKDRYFTLGLPTGSTPLGMYKKLIDYCKNGQLSFQFVKTFNMDEYAGIPKNHPASYHSFMYHNFFRHIDIHPSNVHILDGNAADLNKECEEFEKEIHSAGGIMLFVGGVGSDGHVAFNEPGSSLASRTRVKTLAQETIVANSRFFNNDISQVPTQALTVGVGTLLDAHEFMRFGFSPPLLLLVDFNVADLINFAVDQRLVESARVAQRRRKWRQSHVDRIGVPTASQSDVRLRRRRHSGVESTYSTLFQRSAPIVPENH